MGSVDHIFLDQLVCVFVKILFQDWLAVHLQHYHLTLAPLTLHFKLGLVEKGELSCSPDQVSSEPVLKNAAVL